MNASPTVSVVLPVWNAKGFLAEAVESILSQTLVSLELLIVDDGSTDGSLELAREFVILDDRVKVIALTHVGIAQALNAGIAAARGRYIARMDADDVSEPDRLQKQADWLDAHPRCVALGAAIEVVDEMGSPLGIRTFPAQHAGIIARLFRSWAAAFAHPTLMMRRDALQQVGSYRPESTPSEDLDLWFRLSEVGELANLNEKLLRYRRHRAAVSVRDRGAQFSRSLEIVNAARQRSGLHPLERRLLSPGTIPLAMYHFECARTALMMGPRRTAIRHARAGIAADPGWPEPWIALLACAFPKWFLRSILGLSERVRPMRL